MTAIIVIALMTICICNVAILGFLTLLIYDNKIAHGLVSSKLGENPVSRSPEMTEEEKEDLKEAKKKYEESQKAFEDMMNYNIYKAYDMDEPQR